MGIERDCFRRCVNIRPELGDYRCTVCGSKTDARCLVSCRRRLVTLCSTCTLARWLSVGVITSLVDSTRRRCVRPRHATHWSSSWSCKRAGNVMSLVNYQSYQIKRTSDNHQPAGSLCPVTAGTHFTSVPRLSFELYQFAPQFKNKVSVLEQVFKLHTAS